LKKQVTIIEANRNAGLFNWAELKRYKDLLYFMVLRDVTVLYKQTVLGFAWAILNPLFQIVVFSVVFGSLAGIKPDVAGMPYPLFSCLAVIPWTYFSSAVSSSGASLIGASAIFTKVYFPRIMIPMTAVFSKLVDLSISFLILIGIMIYFGYMPGSNVVFVIIPLLILVLSAAGLGLWFAALSVQYRDFKFALGFLLPLLMYAAPVAFPASLVLAKMGEGWYQVYAAYPMVGVIEGFRNAFAADTAMPWSIMLISLLSASVIFISGALYFKKMEKHFADLA
jgi:lipopolysaccharide transport system permease protein